MSTHNTSRHNLVINHVAVSVDSLEAAVSWYKTHLGFQRIIEDMTIDRAVDGDNAFIFNHYGSDLNKVKIAFMTSGNGVGMEVFEFVDPPLIQSAAERKKEWNLTREYRRGGYFHFAVTASDPEALAKKACADGAMQIGESLTLKNGQMALYLRDPWGNIVEVLSESFERLVLENQR